MPTRAREPPEEPPEKGRRSRQTALEEEEDFGWKQRRCLNGGGLPNCDDREVSSGSSDGPDCATCGVFPA